MKNLGIIDYYYNRVYRSILVIVPSISLCAAVVMSWHTIEVYNSLIDIMPAVIFDFINIFYLAMALLWFKAGFNPDGSVKLDLLKKTKYVMGLLLIFQWNYITYIDVSTEMWGFTFLFIIIAAFFLDFRLLILVEAGIAVSTVISYILLGSQIMPAEGTNLSMGMGLRIVCLVLTVFAIDALVYFVAKFLVNEIEKISNFDPLTHLLNRRTLDATMALCEAAAKDEDKPFCIAIFDLDDFKRINDTYGHENGDVVLREFADILYRGVKSSDYVYRWGGEEFLVIFSCEKEQAVAASKRILAELESRVFKFNGDEAGVTATCGVSGYVKDSNANMMIEIADTKLYIGKNTGKNVVIS